MTVGLVDIVIVNWNSGQGLADCVRSIKAHGGEAVASVVAVDNGSRDGSDQVSSDKGKLEVIRTGENLGFGKACNLGASHGSAEFILFLNPDAALHADSLGGAVRYMQSAEAERTGICGVRLINDTGETQRHCARFPDSVALIAHASGLATVAPGLVKPMFLHDFDHESSRPVDQVIGAFLFIRRAVFESLKGFDERYFVYFEDLDLSFRAAKAGWSSYYLASATAYHKGNGTSEQVKAHRLFYSGRSRIVYAFKHFGRARGTAVAFATLVIEPVPRLVRAAGRRSFGEIRDTLWGYSMLWRDLGNIARLVSSA